jgi:hypothetical protein
MPEARGLRRGEREIKRQVEGNSTCLWVVEEGL